MRACQSLGRHKNIYQVPGMYFYMSGDAVTPTDRPTTLAPPRKGKPPQSHSTLTTHPYCHPYTYAGKPASQKKAAFFQVGCARTSPATGHTPGGKNTSIDALLAIYMYMSTSALRQAALTYFNTVGLQSRSNPEQNYPENGRMQLQRIP